MGSSQSGDDSNRHFESAARHLTTRVPTARSDDGAGEVLSRLAERDLDAADVVYLTNEDQLFQGGVRLERLLKARDCAMGELADVDYPRILLHQDQEAAAAKALTSPATSVAVVDDQGRFHGAITAPALLDILRREHVEDLHRLAGIQRETVQLRSALEIPPLRRARHRLPWLFVGLAGSMVAAIVMGQYEQLLSQNLSIAFFVPAIVYLADAIGTQTETITVRALSLSRLPLRRMLFDELRTGLFIGMTLGLVALPVVALSVGDWRLAISVASSIVVAGAVATTIGMLLPWALQRAGTDPAFGSGPVATVIQDVLSLLIYLAIASTLVL
jgi:magnesium transporter